MDNCARSYYYQKGEIAMKKKNMVLACGAAVALALGSPQMTGVGFAKPFPIYNVGDVLPKNGYIITEGLKEPPKNGGLWELYGYRGFDPSVENIRVILRGDQKIIEFYARYFDGKKLTPFVPFWVEVDIYKGVFRHEFDENWASLSHEKTNNDDIVNTVNEFVKWFKATYPDDYNYIMETAKVAEEKEIAAERERLEKQLTTATDFAQNTPYVFADYGKQIDWAEFTQDPVDYTKTPQLSELIGHVFQLSDTHGFQAFTKDDNKTPYLKIDRRRSALVHFTILPRDKDSYQIALMDDTGDFVGKENINKKPLIRDFKAYHAEYGFYRGLTNEVFHKTGSFNSFGSVIGQSNLVDGFFNGGIVSVGIEKTDEAGKYKLVYYMTSDHRDNYGATSTTTVKYDGVYATLTLVK